MYSGIVVLFIIIQFLFLIYGVRNSRINLFFSFFLLTLFIYFLAHIYWVELQDLKVSLVLVNNFTPLYFLTGPLLYFYVKSILEGDYRFNKNDLLHTIPFSIQVVAISSYVFSPAENKIEILSLLLEDPQSAINSEFNLFFSPSGNFLFRFLSISAYIVMSFRILFKNKHSRNFYRSTYYWLLSLLCVTSLMLISYMLLILNFFKDPTNFLALINGRFAVATFLLLGVLTLLPLFFPHILYGTYKVKAQEKKLTPTQRLEALPNRKMISLSKKIISYFEEKQPYLEREFTLPQLAKEMKVPMHHIQKCFKEVHKTTFVDFKTGYKIQWAVEALYDPSFKNDTIDSIGACAGFNSKSQFYSAFKKHKGLTPYQFVKKHKKIPNKA
jgi:AraC-like DNA-binding protein